MRTRLEALANRFFPGFHLPGFLLGQRLTAIDPADLAYDLAWLWKLGVKDVGGLPVDEAIRRLLRRVDGPRTQIFYSYRVAEALLAFGPTFEGNPLLEDFTGAERENLRAATDTTVIYDPATGTMPGYPNNYWAVLARCEQRRRDLGLLTDPTILDLALARTAGLLFANPAGFFDDSPEGGGRSTSTRRTFTCSVNHSGPRSTRSGSAPTSRRTSPGSNSGRRKTGRRSPGAAPTGR